MTKTQILHDNTKKQGQVIVFPKSQKLNTLRNHQKNNGSSNIDLCPKNWDVISLDDDEY